MIGIIVRTGTDKMTVNVFKKQKMEVSARRFFEPEFDKVVQKKVYARMAHNKMLKDQKKKDATREIEKENVIKEIETAFSVKHFYFENLKFKFKYIIKVAKKCINQSYIAGYCSFFNVLTHRVQSNRSVRSVGNR